MRTKKVGIRNALVLNVYFKGHKFLQRGRNHLNPASHAALSFQGKNVMAVPDV